MRRGVDVQKNLRMFSGPGKRPRSPFPGSDKYDGAALRRNHRTSQKLLSPRQIHGKKRGIYILSFSGTASQRSTLPQGATTKILLGSPRGSWCGEKGRPLRDRCPLLVYDRAAAPATRHNSATSPWARRNGLALAVGPHFAGTLGEGT